MALPICNTFAYNGITFHIERKNFLHGNLYDIAVVEHQCDNLQLILNIQITFKPQHQRHFFGMIISVCPLIEWISSDKRVEFYSSYLRLLIDRAHSCIRNFIRVIIILCPTSMNGTPKFWIQLFCNTEFSRQTLRASLSKNKLYLSGNEIMKTNLENSTQSYKMEF